METIIYSAFCGSGKTWMCNSKDIVAVEVEYWKYKDSNTIDKYINDITNHFGRVNCILISTDPDGLRLLNKAGYNIVLVYPNNSLRSEYLDRYINRDSPPDFIGAFMKYWNVWIDELKTLSFCDHIVLGQGQYLNDIINQ